MTRRRWVVGAVKIPPSQRTIAHAVITDDDDHGYRDIIGSDSDSGPDSARFPYGSEVSYTVELTDEEVDQFATASNLRYLEEDVEDPPNRAVGRPTGTAEIPTLVTLGWLRARYVDLREWHGRDVRVAVLDQGTTQAVRDAMGWTLAARTIVSGITLPPGQEIYDPAHTHGCLVASNAVPAGGQLLDCIITGTNGNATISAEAAGIRWAVDNGAQVINMSYGSGTGPPAQVLQDAYAYARDNGGAQITVSAGNDNLTDLSNSSSGSRLFSGVHSIISFDESTDRRALTSNHAADASGCGPGVNVTSLSITGGLVFWDGTSAAAPHAAQMMVRALTGGRFTPVQVGAAFKANTRDTGAGAIEQGGGAYDLRRGLTGLGVTFPVTAGVDTPVHLNSGGGASVTSGWNLTPAPGVQVDDLQIAILVSNATSRFVPPPLGWVKIYDLNYFANYEITAGQDVNPVSVKIFAAPYTADQPNPSLVSYGANRATALAHITVRAAGGMDPERLAPLVRCGTGTTITTPSVLPATTNDLQICVFAQRQDAATTGSLSLPAGLTQRGFWRPSSGTDGVVLLATTRTLTDANPTPTYSSTANDAAGTWAAITMTVPAGPAAIAPVTQAEPAGPPGGMTPFLPHA